MVEIAYKPPIEYNSKNIIPINKLPNRREIAYVIACSDGFTQQTQIPEDFILKELSISSQALNGSNLASATSYIYVNGILVKQFVLTMSNATDATGSYNQEIKIPEWLLRQGQTIKVTVTNSADSSVRTIVSFIGYTI